MFHSDISSRLFLQILNERAERSTFLELRPAFDFSERQGKIPWRNRAKYISSDADLQGNSALCDPLRNEAERVYALLIHHHFCYSSVNIKRVYLWGRMLPCAPTVGWFVIKGLPRLKEFLSLLNFTMSSTFLCKKKRSWHKHRIVSVAPLIRDT